MSTGKRSVKSSTRKSDAFDITNISFENTNSASKRAAAHLASLQGSTSAPGSPYESNENTFNGIANNFRRQTFDSSIALAGLNDNNASSTDVRRRQTIDKIQMSSVDYNLLQNKSAEKRRWSSNSLNNSVATPSTSPGADTSRSLFGTGRPSPLARRQTADEADLQAMLNGLDESVSSSASSAVGASSPIAAKSAEKPSSVPRVVFSPAASAAMTSAAAPSSPFIALNKSIANEGRRLTADASEIQALIAEIQEDEEELANRSSIHSNMTGSSINTLDLVNQVDKVVGEVEGSEIDLDASTASSCSSRSVSDPYSTKKDSTRRMTADPADMAALLAGLEDESDSGTTADKSTDESQNSCSRVSVGTQNLLNRVGEPAGLGDASDLDVSSLSSHSLRSTRSSRKSTDSVASSVATVSAKRTTRSSAKASAVDRRMTADPADMAALLAAVEASHNSSLNTSTASASSSRISSKKSASAASTKKDDQRRMTADPADMAALLAGLEDDSSRRGSLCTGRESIDTISLVRSVNHMLDDLDESRQGLTESFNLPLPCSPSAADMSVQSVGNSEGELDNVAADREDDGQEGDGETHSSYGSLAGLLTYNLGEQVDSPVGATMDTSPPPSLLKSCLSSKKVKKSVNIAADPPQSIRKNVFFGSPKAAEFNKASPTTSFTPLHPQQAKGMFSMAGSTPFNQEAHEDEEEDEETAENSTILEEWDRLTNNSGTEGSDESNADVSDINEGSANVSVSSSRSARRRRSMLQPQLEIDEHDNSNVTGDATATVALASNLADFMKETEQMAAGARSVHMALSPAHSAGSSVNSSCGSRTQELEFDLQSLLRDQEGSQLDISNLRRSSVVHRSTVAAQLSPATNTSSTASERSLGGFIGRAPCRESRLEDSGEDLSNDLSDIKSDESEVSFRFSLGGRNSIGNISMRSADDGGHTVGLEGNMADLMENLLETGSPAFGSSPRVSLDGEDCTQRLETNLHDILEQAGDVSSADSIINGSIGAAAAALPDTIDVNSSENISNASTASIEFNGMNRSSLLDRPSTAANASFGVVSAATLGFSAAEMLKRLQGLNEGARRKSLSQGHTPLGQIRRASLRRSLALKQQQQQQPATEFPSATKKSRVELNVSSVAVDASTIDDSFLNGDVVDLNTFLHCSGLLSDDAPQTTESLLAKTIRQAMAEASDETRAELTEIFTNLLNAANPEVTVASNAAEDQESMEELWCMVPDSTMRLAFDALIANRKGAKDILSQCIAETRDAEEAKTREWEERLLENVEGMVRARAGDVGKMVCAARAANASEDSSRALLSAAEEPPPKAAVQARCSELQATISAARQALEVNKQTLDQLNEVSSQLLEDRMNTIVSITSAKLGGSASSSSRASSNVDPEEQLAAVRQRELAALDQQIADAKEASGVLNRLSYTRLVTYTSSCIEIEAVLSQRVRAQVMFKLASSEEGGMLVDNVFVELKSDGSADAESLLANAYFATVLCAADIAGPLSERVLGAIVGQSPAEIPRIAQQLSGYISCLRMLHSSLACYNSDGWSWTVEGPVVVLVPGIDAYRLHLPLRVLLSGDVESLDASTTMRSGAEWVFAQEVETVVSAIVRQLASRRATARAAFGAFPAGLFKQYVSKIVQIKTDQLKQI